MKHVTSAIIGIAIGSALFGSGQALACSVYPTPALTRNAGESTDAFLARQQRHQAEMAERAQRNFEDGQRELLRTSPVILIARVTNVRQAMFGNGVQMRIQPIRNIRGFPSLRPMWIDFPEPVRCGRERAGDLALVTAASPEPIIIFANNAILARDTIIDSFTDGPRNAPEIRATLAGH